MKINNSVKRVAIIIPTHNDEKIISKTVIKVNSYLKKLPKVNKYQLVIVENGSIDNTKKICKKLSKEYPKIKFNYLQDRGRGLALRYAFQNYKADIFCFMDSDLATEISYLKKLVYHATKYDMVIGNRYHEKSKTKRRFHRLLLSKVYNTFVNILFGTNFKDLQCGFKAFNHKVVKKIIPLVKDNQWLIDTEIVILSDLKGYKIFELPIVWKESNVSSLKLLKDSIYILYRLIEFKIRIIYYEKNQTLQN